MSDTIKMTRLGDILLEKGLLNATHLQTAIEEQKRRRERINPDDKVAMEATSLGEILIELGYITRQQLKRGLNWQLYLRNMTLVMSLCAPLMSMSTAAAAKPKNGSVTSQSMAAAFVNQLNTAPSNGASLSSLPLIVQAENYTAMSGIEVEPTTDVGGGLNVGYIHEGDWMSYAGTAVNVPATGTYKVTFRVASPLGGGSFAFHEADGSVQYGTVAVPTTGSSQTWVDVEHAITLTAGVHRFGITALVRGSGFNINWFRIAFKGQPLPVTIQAENYSTMMGIETEPTSDMGGGENVGYIHQGDWMSYAENLIDIPSTGHYRVIYRLASPGGYGRFALHEVDGSAHYDTVDVPNTGSSQTWVDVVRTVYLTAGVHRLGITALERGAGFNINWFRIENTNVQPPPTSNSSSSLSSQMGSSQATSASSSSPAASVASRSSAPSLSSSSASSQGMVTASLSSSSASSANLVQAAGAVHFDWNIPTQRENGEALAEYELGGYEIRYRKVPDTEFTYITVEALQTEYLFEWLVGSYEFEIAAFDINGLYSRFVPLVPSS